MRDNDTLVTQHVERLVRDAIEPARYRLSTPVPVEAWPVPGEPVPFRTAVDQAYTPVAAGAPWGAPWSTMWFRVTGTVPAGWAVGTDALELVIDLGFDGARPGFQAEGLIYDSAGDVRKGLNPLNHHLPLALAPGEGFGVYVEAAANPDLIGSGFTFEPTRLGSRRTAGSEPLYRFGHADIRVRDVVVWELEQDIAVLLGLMSELPPSDARRHRVRAALERLVDVVDPGRPGETAAAGRAVLAAAFAAPPSSRHRIAAVGHAHIDSAWLWPARETVRKCARTYANVLHLMDERADLIFACSSAQHLAWVKQHHPALFRRIAARVADGRFVLVGGMWVESDTNLPGGEALVRQFLHGQRFFQTEFGLRSEVGWLPDCFGYSGALPQIAASAGCTAFLVQKLSWNDVNAFPFSSFDWEGIDGTRLFTHAPPVARYNSDLSAADLLKAERDYHEKAQGTVSLVPFGHGDGGGGPTREMMAAADRLVDGLPPVEIMSPGRFFTEARDELRPAPAWTGEMYLEFHRGTYTSQSRTKRGNRRCEHLLRTAELWATTAAVRGVQPYPYDVLRESWDRLLLLQFHDILPGSSIAWVYEEAAAEYAALTETLQNLIESTLRALCGDGTRQFIANAAPFAVHGVDPMAVGPAGSSAVPQVTQAGGRIALRSDRLQVEIDADGHVTSFRDLADGREYIPAGMVANQCQLFRDAPAKWDAWDLDAAYRRAPVDFDGATEVTLDVDGTNPAVRVDRRVGDTIIRQRLSLTPGRAALRIETDVDWHERHKLLKLAFPLDIHSTAVTSEIQFGHITRPTHENTSWDSARFEISGHRWTRVADNGSGIAVANTATYGRDVIRVPRPGAPPVPVVRESLLRAPTFPDPDADQGRHHFVTTLRLAPDVLDAVEEGYLVNLPPVRVTGARPVIPLVHVDDPGVVVEAVKLAEDRSGDVIIRLYESRGQQRRCTVTVPGAHRIAVTDVLENEQPDQPPVSADGITLVMTPFHLVSLRAQMGS